MASVLRVPGGATYGSEGLVSTYVGYELHIKEQLPVTNCSYLLNI